jgi:hypothetical protein
MLFGLSDERIPTDVPPPGENYKPTFPPPAPPAGLPAIEALGIELMYRWSEDPIADGIGDQAISLAALMQSGGGYQYLGDYLLLAWRSISSEETARILAWYLDNQIPSVGFNGLPKAALKAITMLDKRMLTNKPPNPKH